MPDFEMNQATDETIARPDQFDCDPDDFADVPRTRAREGLPAAFRMRHASHYVEQLMGDAPIQSIRQIPIDQIVQIATADGPDGAVDLTELAASIREVGLLQPLLVASRGANRFQLLAGSHRLSAARQAGLAAVPCLLVNADDDAASKLRTHATRRSAAESLTESGRMSIDAAATAEVLRTAFSEISASMRFIDALAPIARIHNTGVRGAMIVNAISVEAHRATTLAAAAALLTRRQPLGLEPVDCAALLRTIRAEAGVEARLKGVNAEWTEAVTLSPTVADSEALATAWSSVIHAMLTVANDGDRLQISLNVPRVRPAIILEATLVGEVAAASVDRFLDTDWPDHPAGRPGTIMLAAALQSARLHGGRLTARRIDDGLALTFVAPQPLD